MKLAVTATAVVTAALLLSACGSSSTTSTNASTQSFQSIVTQAYKYATCMRNHGVTNFPDPQVSSNGSQQKIAIRAVGPNSPRFKTAFNACRSIMPGPSKADLAAQAAAQRERKQDLLSFARCMHGHGVSDFPDPGPQGQLTIAMITQAGIDLHAPQIAAAARACIPASHGVITPADVAQATGSSG